MGRSLPPGQPGCPPNTVDRTAVRTLHVEAQNSRKHVTANRSLKHQRSPRISVKNICIRVQPASKNPLAIALVTRMLAARDATQTYALGGGSIMIAPMLAKHETQTFGP